MGVVVLLGAVLLAVVLGVALRMRDGRIRASRAARSAPTPTVPARVSELISADDAVTLVQLSTTFCVPCRHARSVLSTAAEGVDGLRHAELDITDQSELAKALGVRSTPTTLAFDADGVQLLRISGVPKLAELREAVAPYVTARHRPEG